jgi:hypothetical protein
VLVNDSGAAGSGVQKAANRNQRKNEPTLHQLLLVLHLYTPSKHPIK